jgi:DNA-binding response OmpR family regulator
MLCHEGYVRTFPDGLAALQWLSEGNGPLPQLILLDIELPKMDGYIIARALKAKPALANTTIIMMSSHDGVVDRIKGQLVGAKEYLPKPFTVEALLGTVGPYLHHETEKIFGTSLSLALEEEKGMDTYT